MLIKNVSIIQSGHFQHNRDILIESGRIIKIGRDLLDENTDYKIDGNGKLAIPGLVNCHTHLAILFFVAMQMTWSSGAG